MTEPQLVRALEPIEKRYKQDYSTQERKMLYKLFSWMTIEKFRELCGLVLAVDSYRIPAVADFEKIKEAHPDKFRHIRRVHEPCEICGGTGIRMFLQGCPDRKHVAPAARCECRNGDYWAQFLSVTDAENLRGFVRWLGRNESSSAAVAAADRALESLRGDTRES